MGRRRSAPSPALDARRVPDAIVHVARSRPTTMVGSVTTVVRLAYLLAPNLAARLLKSAMATYVMRAVDGERWQSSLSLDRCCSCRREVEVAPSSIGSGRFGTRCSFRNSACCEGKIIALGRGPEVADQTPAFDTLVGWTLVVAHGVFRAAPRVPCLSVSRSLFFMNRLSKVWCLSCTSREKPAVLGFPLKTAVLPVPVGSRRRQFAWIGNPALINAFCLSWLLKWGAWRVLPHGLKISSLTNFVSAFRHRFMAAGRGKTGLFRN